MLPSSSSHVARYGQINHYKKFWLLQTQLEKQEQPSTALSLGVTGSANVKENAKPLISSNTLLGNGDHNTASHGSCRVDMVSSAPSSSNSSRAGANFSYCSNEPSTSKLYSNGRLEYTHMQSNGSLRRRDSSPLSLAVNCEGVTHPNINFLNQIWAPTASSCRHPASDQLQLRNSPSAMPRVHTSLSHIPLVKESFCSEEWESSECSNERGEKRGQLVNTIWDNASTSPSTSSFSLSSKQLHELAGLQGQFSSSIINPVSLQEAAALRPSSSRSGLGCATGPVRVCTLCGTTKTPLWRSGPQGPKSLCNACGIRVKKTKRLQAAMEAAGEGAEKIIRSASSPAGAYKRLLAAAAAATTKAAGRAGTITHKRKLSMEAAENQSDPFFQLKRKKKKAADRRSSCCSWPPPNVVGVDSGTCYRDFGDLPANLAADSASSKKFSHLFAKDVEEAAVLLMALSCGLVLS